MIGSYKVKKNIHLIQTVIYHLKNNLGVPFCFFLHQFHSQKTKSRSSPTIPRSKALAITYCGIFGYALTQKLNTQNKILSKSKIFYCFTIIIYIFAI